jgi:CRISPR-associated protein Cas1
MVIEQLQQPTPLDGIRGAEGEAAKSYFAVFNDLIVAQNESFTFNGRSRRPPRDRVNAMISFLSVLLTHDVRSACEAVGLDPQVGFLHRDRPGRPSLALDLMEELRPVLVDRLTLSLINRRQVTPGGFRVTESGGVEMDDETRKTLLTAWQKRKSGELNHPFLDEKITLGLLPHIQARLLARHLRGDLDDYPAFFWR